MIRPPCKHHTDKPAFFYCAERCLPFELGLFFYRFRFFFRFPDGSADFGKRNIPVFIELFVEAFAEPLFIIER